jgi:hypothetical protein
MFKGFHGFRCPFFGTITPRTVPFGFAPRVLDETEAVPIVVDCSEKRICMVILNSLASEFVWISMSVLPSTSIEQEFLVHSEEAFVPEQVFVEYVGGDNLGGNSTCEVFDSFSVEASVYDQLDIAE